MTTQSSQHVRHVTSVLPTIPILGVGVHRLTSDQALRLIGESHPEHRMLAYVNAHTLNLTTHNEDLRQTLNGCYLVVNDGLGVSLAARMRGESFLENLNGSDLTLHILELAAQQGWATYFLGGEPGIAELASQRLMARIEGLCIVGTCHGFTGESDESLVQRIKDSGASLLIVALGSPHQEIWLSRNLEATGALLGIGVGAFLDFSAGKVVRAPRWMNVLGVEWCFRLLQEPRRLWRRYVIGNPRFLFRAWRSRRNDMRVKDATNYGASE